jgi:hypothetical protein
MVDFKDLVIPLHAISIHEFIARLEQHQAGGWRRDVEQEDRLRPLADPRRSQFCFARQDHPKYSPAYLWLVEEAPDRLAVANIISEKNPELSPRDYNALLESFRKEVVSPTVAEVEGQARSAIPDAGTG